MAADSQIAWASAGAIWLLALGVPAPSARHVDPPAAYDRYCATYPLECAPSRADVAGNDRLEAVAALNTAVNHRVIWYPNWKAQARGPWRILKDGEQGVCTEFAVTKRARLVAGRILQPGSLSLAIVRIHENDRVLHMVLLARFKSGVYVLNSNSDYLWPLGAVHFAKWYERQEWGDPDKWVATF